MYSYEVVLWEENSLAPSVAAKHLKLFMTNVLTVTGFVTVLKKTIGIKVTIPTAWPPVKLRQCLLKVLRFPGESWKKTSFYFWSLLKTFCTVFVKHQQCFCFALFLLFGLRLAANPLPNVRWFIWLFSFRCLRRVFLFSNFLHLSSFIFFSFHFYFSIFSFCKRKLQTQIFWKNAYHNSSFLFLLFLLPQTMPIIPKRCQTMSIFIPYDAHIHQYPCAKSIGQIHRSSSDRKFQHQISANVFFAYAKPPLFSPFLPYRKLVPFTTSKMRTYLFFCKPCKTLLFLQGKVEAVFLFTFSLLQTLLPVLCPLTTSQQKPSYTVLPLCIGPLCHNEIVVKDAAFVYLNNLTDC